MQENHNSAVSQKLRKTGKLQGALSAIRNEGPSVVLEASVLLYP